MGTRRPVERTQQPVAARRTPVAGECTQGLGVCCVSSCPGVEGEEGLTEREAGATTRAKWARRAEAIAGLMWGLLGLRSLWWDGLARRTQKHRSEAQSKWCPEGLVPMGGREVKGHENHETSCWGSEG